MIFIKNNIITFSLYYFTTLIIVKLMLDPTQAILVWPAAGVGIATALIWGYRVIPGLYLAQVGITFLLYSSDIHDIHDFYKSNLFIIIGMSRCYLGAFLIRYFVGPSYSLVSHQSILKFFIIGGILANFISTIAYDFLKYYLDYKNSLLFNESSLDWWFGDIFGFVIFAPITLMLICKPRSIWRPRLFSVGLPMILVLLSVIFIYNKYQKIDNKRVIEQLQITNNLIASKLEQNNNWINKLIDSSLYHFVPKENSQNSINNYFSNLKNSNNGANAIIWELNGKVNYVKVSTKYSKNQFDNIKNLDYETLRDEFILSPQKNYFSKHLEKTNDFINLYEFSKSRNKELFTIFVVHNPTDQIKILIKKFRMLNTTISLKIDNSDRMIPIHESITRDPEKNIIIKSDFKFNNEIWTLVNQPSARYLFHNKSNLSSIIAKIGLMLTGLIGMMLMILSGKNTILNKEVKKRTLDLDNRAENFKNRKIEYQKLIEQHPVTLWRQNLSTKKMSYISNKVEGLYGYSIESWLEEEDFWINHIHKNDRGNIQKIIGNSIVNKEPFELQYRFITKDNSIAWIKDVINIRHDVDSNIQLIGLMVDITETHKAKLKQSISETKYRTLFKHATDALLIIDLNDGSFKDLNEKAIKMLGIENIDKPLSLSDVSILTQPNGSTSKKLLEKIYRKVIQSNTITFEWFMLNHKQEEILCNIELIKLPDDNNIALADISDITDKKLHEKKINQLAYYDNLTKLPNREYFYSKFSYFHERATIEKKFSTIIYLDLDRFKILNDSLGHQAGDELLKLVAQRIRKAMQKKHDFCARLGGDEFIVLSKKLNETIEGALETSLEKSERIIESLNEPYQLGDYEHHITPSIGISIFPVHGKTLDQIIHHADVAMYKSKSKGKNAITIYQANMVKHVGERLELEQAIRQALDQKEFRLFYQLQHNTKSDSLSVEALLRWHRLEELNINTEKLIDLVEEIGLTNELGHWVFDCACAQLESWQKQGKKIKTVAINVSSKQFHQKSFIQQIKSIISSYNINPSQIVIELTEAVIIEDIDSLTNKLIELREYGIKISLDDFGTGYSSLAYLQKLPVDQLKIDKMFIDELTANTASKHIVKTIIDLANLLDIEIIAEGVEKKEQFEILKHLGCINFQGFYFAQPVPVEDIILQHQLPK